MTLTVTSPVMSSKVNMSISFKASFRAIYQWQSKHYELKAKAKTIVNFTIVPPPILESKIITTYPRRTSEDIAYKVIKWSHCLLSQLTIISFRKKTGFKCTDEHMRTLIRFIDEGGDCGTTLNEIKQMFSMEPYTEMDIDIWHNADIMVEFLLQLRVLGTVNNESISTKEELPKYKLVDIPSSLTDTLFKKQIKNQLNKIKLEDLPSGCNLEHVERLLYHMDSGSAHGKSVKDIITDMTIGNNHICKQIADNADKLVTYCANIGVLYVV